MSLANQVQAGALAEPAPPVVAVRRPWWESRALFRYGFVALILIVWQLVAPYINPIFFAYPSQIAAAFYETDGIRRIALFPRPEPAR